MNLGNSDVPKADVTRLYVPRSTGSIAHGRT
jgi:hypothetical protein